MTLLIATDGAGTEKSTGARGWAWVSENGQYEYGRLEDDLPTNVTELQAIARAILAFPESEDLHIVSDSRSSVRRIQEPHMYEETPELKMARQIIEMINQRSGSVELEWIRSHNGHQLNGRADRLAKKGVKLSRPGEMVSENSPR